MKNDDISQSEPRKSNVNRVTVDRLKALIRTTWPDEFGSGTNIIQFPRAKKRGAKVRTGPCAQIIPLPGIYIGDELDERYEWITDVDLNWRTTKTDGAKVVDWSIRALMEGMRLADGEGPLTDHEKRARIAKGCARIETRNRIKTYLEWRGVDLDKIRSAEDALFTLFGLVGDAT